MFISDPGSGGQKSTGTRSRNTANNLANRCLSLSYPEENVILVLDGGVEGLDALVQLDHGALLLGGQEGILLQPLVQRLPLPASNNILF
jgi:hypothetical protein